MKTLIAATALFSLALGTTLAQADETLKFKGTQHAVSVTSQPVPDVDGHLMTLVTFSGLIILPDGSVGQQAATVTTDYIKGSGTFTNYTTFAFDDGSALFVKINGTAKAGEKTTNFSGPLQVIGGKGKYAGATGDGTISGTRFAPLLVTGAELVADFTVNIKK
jgi:hypothetical protein